MQVPHQLKWCICNVDISNLCLWWKFIPTCLSVALCMIHIAFELTDDSHRRKSECLVTWVTHRVLCSAGPVEWLMGDVWGERHRRACQCTQRPAREDWAVTQSWLRLWQTRCFRSTATLSHWPSLSSASLMLTVTMDISTGVHSKIYQILLSVKKCF